MSLSRTFARWAAAAVVAWAAACPWAANAALQAGTGDVVETEVDFVDASPHPLTFTRHYRSSANLSAGLGGGWSHNWAARAAKDAVSAVVRFGTGSTEVFSRAPTTGTWQSGRNKLVETAGGLLYIRESDESQWQFDIDGKLAHVTQRNGWRTTFAYNAVNQLERVTNAFGRTLTLAYEANGKLATVTFPDGTTTSYTHDANGRLASASYADGSVNAYTYAGPPYVQALTSITVNGSPRVTYSYDLNGRGGSMQLPGVPTHTTVSYPANFSTSSRLIAGTSVDPSLYLATIQTQDENGNVVSQTWQGGDGHLRPVGASSPLVDPMAGRTLGDANLPVVETDYLGVQTTKQWDATRKLLLSTTEASNTTQARTTQTTWHASFRLPVRIDEPGRTTTYTHDALGNVLSETVTDTGNGQARTTSWTYGSNNLPATTTDSKGGVWTYGYDSAGNRTAVTDPAGRTSTLTYDAAGRVLTETNPAGTQTSYTYDTRGRLAASTTAGESTAFAYNATGLLASATFPNGYQVSYSYDAAQRLVGAADNLGATITFTLDGVGNRVREEVRDAGGNIALATGRALNALYQVASQQSAAGATTQYGYDANGELTSTTDPLNQTTRQTLDPLRRPTATTFADNASAQQAWNPLDQLTQLTDPKAVSTTYTYNAFGEVLTETSPDIGTIRYTRDASGDVIAAEDAKGQVTQIDRDALGRPTYVRYADGTAASYAYDAAGRVSRIEDRSGVTAYERDALGRVTARTQDVNDAPGSPSRFRIGYSYSAGDLTGITYPSGLKVTYRRVNGRITGIDVQEPGGSAKKPKPVIGFVTNLAHTALGQPRAWSWFNGDAASRSFDADGRMTANEFANYIYDAASRITGITQQLWMEQANADGSTTLATTALNWQAGYDNRNRLTSFVRDGSETRYTYDANSNRLTAIDKTTSDTDLDGEFESSDFSKATGQALNIDASSNRLLGFSQTLTTTNTNGKVKTTTSGVTYALDANGSLTSDGLRDFVYGADGRLAKVRAMKDGEAAIVSYLTNALGQRVFKSEPVAEQTLPNEATLGTEFITWLKKQFGWMFTQAAANTSIGTAYVYGDGAIPPWAILGEYDNGSASGKGRTEYIWLPTEDGSAIPVGIYRNGNFFAVHTDHLGTPRLMTNEAKKPVWQWPYSAFGTGKPTGVLKATPNPKAAITNKPVLLKATAATEMNLRFPGQYFDAEAGTAYNRFRDYDSSNARYRQSDPIGLGADLNRFGYVRGNGLRSADPHGLFLETFWDIGNVIYDIWHQQWDDLAWDTAAMCIPGVPAGVTKVKNLVKATSGETKFTNAGRRAHAQEPLPPGFDREVPIPGTRKRMDGYNPETKEVIEIKPDNARAVRRGEKQAQDYCDACNKSPLGPGHTARPVQTYDPKKYLK